MTIRDDEITSEEQKLLAGSFLARAGAGFALDLTVGQAAAR